MVIIALPRWKRTPDGEGVDAGEFASKVVADSLPEVAVCFLRVPPTQIEDGLDVLRAWGFCYQTCIASDPPNPGEHVDANLWFCAKLDLILIGVRGGLPQVPEDELLWDRPIDHFVKGTLKMKIGKWLPNVKITMIA